MTFRVIIQNYAVTDIYIFQLFSNCLYSTSVFISFYFSTCLNDFFSPLVFWYSSNVFGFCESIYVFDLWLPWHLFKLTPNMSICLKLNNICVQSYSKRFIFYNSLPHILWLCYLIFIFILLILWLFIIIIVAFSIFLLFFILGTALSK